MKSVLVLANFDVGLYKFRKELLEELIRQGNTVYISLPQGEFVEQLEKIGCIFANTPIDRRGINPITDSKLLFTYLALIKKVKPDMVITYTIKPNIYGGIVCRLRKIPYAINITGLGTTFQNENFLKKLVCFLYKISCKNASKVFFENQENERIFIENKLIKKQQAVKLNGAGVNLEDYPFCEYPLKQETVRFLFVGRVMKEKGVDELFEVADKIKKKYSSVIFDIVGPMEDDYQEKIRTLTQKNIIQYHGFQSDVKPFIEQSNCFVLPSYHEGMANTLLECGAMGRPLITSKIHGCIEAVQEGENGFLVEVMSSKKLEKAIEQFILLPYEKKKEMGAKSNKLMGEKFNRKKVVENTIRELY